MAIAVFFIIGLGMLVSGGYLMTQGLFTSGGVLILSGMIVLMATAAIQIFTRLYLRVSANRVFVRSGAGGVKVVREAGLLVVPAMHQVIWVSLETMRLSVELRGCQALTSTDGERMNVSAHFYVKVEPECEDILLAARSLGERTLEPARVGELLEEKLAAALRRVAGSRGFPERTADVEDFASGVQEIAAPELALNGLTLESVTISSIERSDARTQQEQDIAVA